MKQQKNSLLDPVTVHKVLKSLILSLLSGAAVFITGYSKTNDWKLSLILALAAILAPFLPNTAVEYTKGE